VKSIKQNVNRFSLSISLFFLSIWILSIFSIGCQGQNKDAEKNYKDILGYWKVYDVTGGHQKEVFLKRYFLRADGKFFQTEYELNAQCRVWHKIADVKYKNGNFYFGESLVKFSADKDSIFLDSGNWQFLYVRDDEENTKNIFTNLESSIGRSYKYKIPDITNDGWECADLLQVGIEKEKIVDLINRITQGKYGDTQSLLISKDGKLVLEEYFAAQGKMFGPLINQIYRDRIHQQSSVTKTFASAVFGVAVDKGYIKDVNQPVYDYFPEYYQFRDEQKNNILLKHALTMTTGLKWDENAYSYSDPRSDLYQWARSDDLLKFYLERPVVAEPGETFSYSCASTMLLGEVVKRTTGSYIDVFADTTLFKELGIRNYEWFNGDTLISIHTGGLDVCPRDMAKLGQLFLNDGKWNGRQIISKDWVRESIRAHKVLRSGFFGDKKSYGYQWWQRTCQIKNRNIDAFYAIGGGGQFIFVIPEFDMVVVSTAQNFDKGWSRKFYSMVNNYVLPAVVATKKD